MRVRRIGTYRYRVVAPGRQRLAAQQPASDQQTAPNPAVTAHRFEPIGATGRFEPADTHSANGPGCPIEPDHGPQRPCKRATNGAGGGSTGPRHSPCGDPGGGEQVHHRKQTDRQQYVAARTHRGRRPTVLAGLAGPPRPRNARSRARPNSSEDAVALSGKARTSINVPDGMWSSRARICSRNRRRTRLRTTALPTLRPTTKPTRGGGRAADSAKLSTSRLWITSGPLRIRPPLRPIWACSTLVRTRFRTGSMTRRDRIRGGSQADSSLRPLRRRADSTARPARVRIRSRKPCVLARRRLFGWKVRLLTEDSGRQASKGQRWWQRRCRAQWKHTRQRAVAATRRSDYQAPGRPDGPGQPGGPAMSASRAGGQAR